jgi:hypothetical protein
LDDELLEMHEWGLPSTVRSRSALPTPIHLGPRQGAKENGAPPVGDCPTLQSPSYRGSCSLGTPSLATKPLGRVIRND